MTIDPQNKGHKYPYDTKKHSYKIDEVVSALQKDIRRGNEENAMYWALEICQNGEYKSGFSRLINRLKVIVYEDVGVMDNVVVNSVVTAIDTMDHMYNCKPSSMEWQMVLSYIILVLCRSEKSRETDHFKTVMINEWKYSKIKRPIPDYALDMHTSRGRDMDRRVKHFRDVGSVISPDNSNDKYKERAYEVWFKFKKHQR